MWMPFRMCCKCTPPALERASRLAVGETAILLQPPLPLVGGSIWMERGCHQNDSLADGYSRWHHSLTASRWSGRCARTCIRRSRQAKHRTLRVTHTVDLDTADYCSTSHRKTASPGIHLTGRKGRLARWRQVRIEQAEAPQRIRPAANPCCLLMRGTDC